MSLTSWLRRTITPPRIPRRGRRPALELLECRLAPAAALFDAPWRGYDTGYYPDAFGPSAVAAGDLDGDGDADAVVSSAYWGGPGVSVLKNNGDGTYAAPQAHVLPMRM